MEAPVKKLAWFERQLTFGLPKNMLPFYLERLEGTAPRIEFKIKDQPDEILSWQVGGKWSIKQNIGHLSEVDTIGNRRIDEMLAGIAMLSPAVFDTRLDYNAMPVGDVIGIFTSGRIANLLKYHKLTDAELGKASIHPRLKVPMTPVDLAWFDAEHDDHHLVTINDLLQTLSNGPL